MADSVTATHGGVTVTTNTMSEADLRTELQAPASEPPATSAPPGDGDRTPHDQTPAPAVRDEKGRFAPKGDTLPLEPVTPPDVPGTSPDVTEPAPGEAPGQVSPQQKSYNQRIAKILQQKAVAERRAAELEAEVTQYRRVTAPVTPPQALPPAGPPAYAEPQFEQFADAPDPYTAYVQAWARWNTAQTVAQARVEWEAAQTAKTKEQVFQKSLTEGRATYPDFDEVSTQADTLGLQVSAVMQDAIAESPRAADLVHYLATHPEECIQLAEESRQTPVAAAVVMRRLLESRLAPRTAASNGAGTVARAPVSTAKPPVTPVGSSPVVSDEPPGDSASASEHARYWNRKLKVPGTR